MTIELLIHAVVRQTTVLIAQLATSRRARAPLAQVASQVFLELVRELERQGVSRKVSADMFGLGLRTYQRKIQRLTESSTDQGRSLWRAVLDYAQSRASVSRPEVFERFAADDEVQVRGVLHDLCESGLLEPSGVGATMVYRTTNPDEFGALQAARALEGLDELVWVLIYREGPVTIDALAQRLQVEPEVIRPSLDRLTAENRVDTPNGGDWYRASEVVLPLGSPVGFEAAVFDHFQAVVNTITKKLQGDGSVARRDDRIGGSTYTVDVWPGHPLEAEAYDTLRKLRMQLGDLRERVERHNTGQELPEDYVKVVLYAGQCLIPEGNALTDDNE
jgi:hypothetical protein